MSANVETAVYSNKPAWHREGIVLDTDGAKGLTIAQALPASGLDWEVEKAPAFAFALDQLKKDEKGRYTEPKRGAEAIRIPDRFTVQRTSDNKPFGTVGRTWQPVQNAEGFALIDDLIREAGDEMGAWIEAAGALDGGRKVWVLAHLDTGLQIAGEDYREYILFTNGHDGRTSVTAATTNVRVVCENTLALALALDGNPRVIRVRHTVKAADRIKEARNILGLRNAYTEGLAQQGEWLVEQEMSEGQFEKFLAELMPSEDIDKGETTPAATMIGSRRTEIRAVYNGADNLEPIKGTRWAALQATLEYADHRRVFRSAETQVKAQFGLNGQAVALKDRALHILRDPQLRATTA